MGVPITIFDYDLNDVEIVGMAAGAGLSFDCPDKWFEIQGYAPSVH